MAWHGCGLLPPWMDTIWRYEDDLHLLYADSLLVSSKAQCWVLICSATTVYPLTGWGHCLTLFYISHSSHPLLFSLQKPCAFFSMPETSNHSWQLILAKIRWCILLKSGPKVLKQTLLFWGLASVRRVWNKTLVFFCWLLLLVNLLSPTKEAKDLIM